MSTLWKGLLVLGIVAFVTAPAFAQQPERQRGGMRGGGGGGVGALLQNKSVQQEVKATDDQIEKARAVGTKVREKYQDELTKLRDLPAEERREKRQAVTKKIADEVLKGLGDVLKPEQMKRLQEIALQQRGANALLDPEIQKTLKMTDEQKTKIKTITDDAAKARTELTQGARWRGQFPGNQAEDGCPS